MTVKEFYEYGCESDLKVLSSYNGKVLCKRFDPKNILKSAKEKFQVIGLRRK